MLKKNNLIKWGLPHILWQILFFLIPLVLLFILSLKTYTLGSPLPGYSLSNYKFLFSESPFLKALLNSLFLAFLVSILTSLLALFGVLGLWRIRQSKIRYLLLFVCTLVFFVGIIPRTFSLSLILSNYGPIHFYLQKFYIPSLGFELYSYNGLILAYVSVFVPLSMIVLFISRSKINIDYIDAAQEFGASWLRKQFLVVIPLMRSSIKLSVILIFILTFADINIIDLIGGSRVYTASYMVIDFVKIDNWGIGAATAFLMLLSVLIVLGLFIKLLAREINENE